MINFDIPCRKYVALVTIESPSESVFKSRLDKRTSFNDQLSLIGGTLGIYVGISVISMFEVMILILVILKSVAQDLNTFQNRILTFLRSAKMDKKKISLIDVEVCRINEAKKFEDFNGAEKDQYELKKLYVSEVFQDSLCAKSNA